MNRAGLAAYSGLVEEAGTDPCGAVAAAGKRERCPPVSRLPGRCLRACGARVAEHQNPGAALEPGSLRNRPEPPPPPATTPHNARI